MIDTKKLRGAIAAKELSMAQVAKLLGICPQTFYTRMKKGVFNSTEIAALIDILEIDDPMAIFFADRVT